MDFKQFEYMLKTSPRFVQLQNNPSLLNNLLNKMAAILQSGKIKDECINFLKNQKDLDRYIVVARKIANLNHQTTPWQKSIVDESLQHLTDEEVINVYEDDVRSLAYQLDVLTNGKHSFYERCNEKLSKTNFKRGGLRSSVGSFVENGKQIWYINVDCSSVLNNRTAAMHEIIAHAIDEKNMNYIKDMRDIDQFIGETFSMFIDKIGVDYLVNNYPSETQMINGLKQLQSESWNNIILKSKESYLDACICKMLYANSPEERKHAEQVLFDGFGNVWSPRMVEDKINQLYDVVINPRSHFDPMYEFRYVVGELVSKAVYDQNISLRDKVDNMAVLNDNIKTLSNIRTDKNQSPIDAVTNHLGIDNLEQLTDNYVQTISRKYTESCHRI